MFNLVLPLEGAYSLTGRFADQPDRLVFDKLKIKSGNNDISGDMGGITHHVPAEVVVATGHLPHC